MDNQLVIPTSLHRRILENLHSAHQGLNGRCARAQHTVYWPSINNCLQNYQQICIQIAPSQVKEASEMSATPEWRFQRVRADYFDHKGHDY